MMRTRVFLALAITGMLCCAATAARAGDYSRDVWSPLHLAPNTGKATDAQCLACHREILEAKPKAKSQSGIDTASVSPWYQSLGTYVGGQETFHRRHLATTYARQVMNLKCSTCHLGHDPRDNRSVPQIPADGETPLATMRKNVNPEKTCLMCHGKFPFENMGLPGEWSEIRADMESADAPNGCLTCHGDQIRTVRHQVNYLNAANIEDLAKSSSDVCYGCHGGRAWYRISFPYPRHVWPGMPDETPDWAKDRPAESDPRFLEGLTTTSAKK